jgi:colanic acid biosynthesis glycosyl transferase WcaI
VDLGAIKPLEEGDNAFRSELGLSKDAFVVLYSGHIGVKQALDVVLDAARKLSSHSDVFFVIAGEGPVKTKLQKDYRDLTRVRFLPLQPVERLNELLNLANLHVLPQHKGAADLVFPSKLAGMLASGKPVAVTADSGTEIFDMLQEIALISPAGDVEALAASILQSQRTNMATNVSNGLKLANALSAQKALPQFTELLVKPQEEKRATRENPVTASAPRFFRRLARLTP